jgi:lipopolysaccharide assembly outer membrane protein LptD (OstA)
VALEVVLLVSCFSKSLVVAILISVFFALTADSILAQYIYVVQPKSKQEKPDKPETQTDKQAVTPAPTPTQDDKADKKERKKQKQAQQAEAEKNAADKTDDADNGEKKSSGKKAAGEEVTVVADKQSKDGELFIYEGYVNVTTDTLRLQADRVVYNEVTGDAIAEGNVIFDEGTDQRVTAKRAEINLASSRGMFWETTGFTNRTQTGEYIYFTAERIVKTGPTTYELYEANITSCEDVVPKWNFKTKRAEIQMGDRITLHNAVFQVKSLPTFILPYAWIPSTRTGRKSGFLIPTTGSSNQKGRTIKTAYYQTLGPSADVTFRSDIYTSRGLGFGAEFRAQTDEKSYMRLGVFTVKDRLFGVAGENQGGTAFVGEGVQYLPNGWLAVGNVSLVSSLRFRQAFSDDISQVVDPRRESTFYANNNNGNFSFNFLASNETTTLFRPNRSSQNILASEGTNFDVKIRQAPQLDLTMYSRRLFDNLPIYLSFDSSVGALKREETVDGNSVSVSPAAVQRFDFQPKLTIPLATFAGIAITPSLSLRGTFYSSSLNPLLASFDPEKFAASPDDPRLNPTLPEYNPSIKLFNREQFDPIIPENLTRQYAELAVDIRPPALEKIFLNADGSRRFKHLIEPYITYRLIKGIGEEFNKIIRFDERDAVANTNEFEYAVVNRFFTTTSSSEFRRKKKAQKQTGQFSEMEIESPETKRKRSDKENKQPQNPNKNAAAVSVDEKDRAKNEAADTTTAASADATVAQKSDEAGKPKKMKLATGEQAELKGDNSNSRTKRDLQNDGANLRGDINADDTNADNGANEKEANRLASEDARLEAAAAASNEGAPSQAYEFLTIKVAQKYFFDRDFGGALTPFQRNQFYPLNTLTGFTFAGRVRSFSPANIQMRYRPLSSVFADLRMDVGTEDGVVRNVTISGGFDREKYSVSTSWFLSRRLQFAPNQFEAGTFPGNQLSTTLQFGDEGKGLYGGTRIGYDFTDRFESVGISNGRLRNSRSYIGYAYDCCGVQFNYNTFKAGLRNESAFSFTFSLAGLGSFGTDQFSQLGGGRGGRKRGKKAAAAYDYNY